AIEWGSKDIHLEHVMPQKPSGSWLKLKKQDEDLYDEYLNRIGNLTLLQDKLNQSASNKDFKTKKKEYYSKSRLFVTKEHFKNYNLWGYDEIQLRQLEILSLVNKIWKV
ncbi:MAG: HNH endonuclease family protein, partial [Sphingobacteriales bacterium]